MNRDGLFLSNDILMSVEKPERYIGHEVNSCIKDPEDIRVRFVMCFPDVYEIGMSHLGIQIIYDMLNKKRDQQDKFFDATTGKIDHNKFWNSEEGQENDIDDMDLGHLQRNYPK